MKQLSLFSIALLLAGVLSVQASHAEDYTCGNVPDDALIQMGRGFISGEGQAVVYSPDGTRLAMATANGMDIRLCDAHTGTEVALLTGHMEPIALVFFSSDGTRVAGVSEGGTIRVWNVADGRQLAVLRDPTRFVTSVFFSPDGTSVASVSKGGTIRVWNVADGRQLAVLQVSTEPIVSVSFSPDGTRVAGVSKGGTIRVWNVADGQQLAVLNATEPIALVFFSPDGTRVAGVSEGGTARVWDVANGQQLAVLNATEPIALVFFSPDGMTVASISEGGTARVWDVADGRQLAVLNATEPIVSMFFSPDGTTLTGVSRGGTVRVWNAAEWTAEEKPESTFAFTGGVESKAYTAGTAITPLVLPEATGGDGGVTYRVSNLPAGLAFDTATRTISGTPDVATGGTTVEVTYTAEDSAGAATLTFSITINPPLSFGDFPSPSGAGPR